MPDYRSVSRKFDEYMLKGDYTSALDISFQAIKEFDSERDYVNSINLLEKMLISIKNPLTKSKLISHVIIRSMITGDSIKTKSYREKLNELEQTSISRMVNNLFEAKEKSEKYEYILDGIEQQTIFGNFEPVENIPFLEFENEDAVYVSMEDYFNFGRYIVNLIQVNSNFHHSITIDIGDASDVSITEKRRIMKLDN